MEFMNVIYKHNDKPIRQLLIFGWHFMGIKSKFIVC